MTIETKEQQQTPPFERLRALFEAHSGEIEGIGRKARMVTNDQTTVFVIERRRTGQRASFVFVDGRLKTESMRLPSKTQDIISGNGNHDFGLRYLGLDGLNLNEEEIADFFERIAEEAEFLKDNTSS